MSTAVRRHIELGKNRVEDDPNQGFRDDKHFVTDVIRAGRTGRASPLLERLRVKAVVGSDEHSSEEGAYGAFLVPSGFAPREELRLNPLDPTLGKMTEIQMSNPVIEIPARTDKDHTTSVTGGLTVTRKPQTTDIVSSRLVTERVTLRANSLFGIAYFTNELLSDALDLAGLLWRGFNDEVRARLLYEKLFGTGVGEYAGVVPAISTIQAPKQTGQPVKTVIKENIDGMIAQCWSYPLSMWLANEDALPQLRSLAQAVGSGGAAVPYLTVDPGTGLHRLAGQPIYFTEFCAALGSPGDIVLGVWSEYLHGVYQPMQTASSVHVRFVEHESALKFWLRDDAQVWWRSTLKPRNSSVVKSPFVVLAQR